MFDAKYSFANMIIYFLVLWQVHSSNSVSSFLSIVAALLGLQFTHRLFLCSLFSNALSILGRFSASVNSYIICIVVCLSHALFSVFSFSMILWPFICWSLIVKSIGLWSDRFLSYVPYRIYISCDWKPLEATMSILVSF